MLYNPNEFESVASQLRKENKYFLDNIDFVKKFLNEKICHMINSPNLTLRRVAGFKIIRNPPDSHFQFSIVYALNETT